MSDLLNLHFNLEKVLCGGNKSRKVKVGNRLIFNSLKSSSCWLVKQSIIGTDRIPCFQKKTYLDFSFKKFFQRKSHLEKKFRAKFFHVE